MCNELTEDEVQIVEQDLKKFSDVFEELNHQMRGENRDDEEESRQKYQKYIQELKEDIEDIPRQLIDYQLREIEIYLIDKLLFKNEEPVLSQQQKDLIKAISLSGEGGGAQKQILAGTDIIRNMKILRKHVCGLDIYEVYRQL